MSVRWGLTVDTADPPELARFWAGALRYAEPDPPAGYADWGAWLLAQGVPEQEWGDSAYLADPQGVGPSLSFLRVPEAKVVKNRLHLDLKVSGGRDVPQRERERRIRAEVARLTDAGARTLTEHAGPGGLDHVTMADPEGNEFCVV
ncbi:conserved hypothetical protein [Beutenbergia cavernae DSM 12333]|uniref:Glyoxalase-like domain-containing protein n=1 Tax=Beutenbergia cavernae (strain ATCC BAA-8 / DSM 12333 / CCUG 43141 / JCM 11478 / NBRC 16432 / NCIMB 13614 / HKI 0122) TaxID=471853 RepID=C5BXE7_BEUC1|nr:VOC family protein [Beutenbergia cavernae]ACQ80830.1 conserved hypothetical protein [Beutenbergia cavernae DSM 12333]